MRVQHTAFKPLLSLQIGVLSLILAALACTSKDTLFIHLTDTPTPTITPTPLSQVTKFKIGDKVNVVTVTILVDLAQKPGPMGGSMFSTGSCSPNQEVTILDISKNVDIPGDPVLYYKVECSGDGWVPEYILTHLEQYASAIVTSQDGKGAAIYSEPNFKSKPVSDKACADGTTVNILNLTLNPDTAVTRQGEETPTPRQGEETPTPDYNIYAQVTCDGMTGYVLEKLLTPPPTATITPSATSTNTPTVTPSGTPTSTDILTVTPSPTPSDTPTGTPSSTTMPTVTPSSTLTGYALESLLKPAS